MERYKDMDKILRKMTGTLYMKDKQRKEKIKV